MIYIITSVFDVNLASSKASFTLTREELENAALFLRLGAASTVIRHEKRAFLTRSSNLRNLKTPALRFCVNWKHFEKKKTELLESNGVTKIMGFP